MHLWPSTRLRDSFKRDYLTKLQFNFRRMNTHTDDTTTATTDLLNTYDNQADGGSCIFCKDVLMIFSLCFCCCGGGARY